MAFIYVIENNINHKKYVGKTNTSVEKRFRTHIKDSQRRATEHRPLYRAFDKYGIENFAISIIEECDADEASEREVYWISKLATYGSGGYNATLGGDSRHLYDYKEIAKKYLELKTLEKTANYFSCSKDTVSIACKQCGIKITSNTDLMKQKVANIKMIDIISGQEKEFQSLTEAALYIKTEIVPNSKTTLSKVRHQISLCCRGLANSSYKRKWYFI